MSSCVGAMENGVAYAICVGDMETIEEKVMGGFCSRNYTAGLQHCGIQKRSIAPLHGVPRASVVLNGYALMLYLGKPHVSIFSPVILLSRWEECR